jgi:type IV pilus assembly protein PilE
MRKRLRGFTLVELMIAVAVAGIIAAIAIPAYGDYVLRGNRTVAKTLIMRIVGQQEGFYTDRKRYAATLDVLSPDYAASTVHLKRDANTQAASSSDTIYAITLTGTNDFAFTVQATAENRQTKDTECLTLTYTNLGVKTPTTGNCWTR